MTTIEKIHMITDEVRDLLVEKNTSYGDSALEPMAIFSTADPIVNLGSRIDDKLARIKTMGFEGYGEDNVKDLIGYLILLQIAIREKANEGRMLY